MKPMKLLPHEAVIYEGLKAGKTVSEISKELGDLRGSTNNRILKMIKFGIISREGYRRNYVYTIRDKPYVIVNERRVDECVEVEDKLLSTLDIKLSDADLQKVRDNLKTESRTALAKELGITKLQLNHVMNEMVKKKKRE
jgi:predicted transcriptional regulator